MNRIFVAPIAALVFLLVFPHVAVAQCPSTVWSTKQQRTDGSSMIDRLYAIDFDGDGVLDLVGLIDTGSSAQNTLNTWRGVGDGTFEAPVSLGLADIYDLKVADVNNDGHDDLVMINSSYQIVVLLGTGSGFGAPMITQLDYYADRMAVGRADGDGFVDVVTTAITSNFFAVYHGDGTGHFVETRRVATPVQPAAIAVADFDGDGRLDVAYGAWGTPDANRVYVAYQNTDGTFTPPISIQAGLPLFSSNGIGIANLDVGDFNEDGLQDLVAVNWDPPGSTSTVVVFLSTGSRSFNRTAMGTRVFHGSTDFTSVRVADVNGDGHLDIVAGSVNGGIVMTFAGKGDGTFRSPSFYTLAGVGHFESLALGDFDGDHHLDLAAGTYQQLVTATNTCGTGVYLFTISQVITSGQAAPMRVLVSGISASTPLPRGIVTFREGLAVLGTAAVDDTGYAQLDIGGLTLGVHTITADFGGNAENGPGTSQAVVETVKTDWTVTTANLPPGPSVYGTPYTFTVNIKDRYGASILGYFTFDIDGVSTERWSGGLGALSVTLNLAPGPHTITVSYFGDFYYPASTTGPIHIVTSKAASSLAKTGGETTVRLGQPHVLQFSISGVPGAAIPGGTVQLMRGTSVLGQGVVSNGAATVSTTLQLGAYDLVAAYSGDSNYNSATANVTLSVLPNVPLAIDARGLPNAISIRAVLPADTTQVTLYREVNGTGQWLVVAGWLPSLEFDIVPSRGVLYDYQLQVVTGSGEVLTSNVDSAMLFNDDPLVSGTTVIKRAHFDDLRLAINLLRYTASLPPVFFDSTYAQPIVNASHLTTLRTALTEAMQALGMPAPSFTDVVGPGTTIKAVHLQELRELTR